MTKKNKILQKILSGTSDHNIDFNHLCNILKYFNFEERIKGGHYIFYRNDIIEIINLQPRADGKAKAYQVKQVRDMILKYKLGD